MKNGEEIRLLLVEDDEDFGEVLVLRLKKAAFDAAWVKTAEDALREMENDSFDVIVSDIKLPEMDGMDFLARVREMGLDVPVIMLTGYGSLESAQESVRLDASDYLLKPLDTLEDLLDPIRKAVHSYRLGVENAGLVKQLVEAREREQRRIGRDLHDGVCQYLTALALRSQELTQRLLEKQSEETERSARITEMLGKATAETRSLAEGLCPVMIEKVGLAKALSGLADDSARLFGIRCPVTCDDAVSIGDLGVATHLYRIAQEAVNNAAKHGNATEVRISLSGSDGSTALIIEDNGRGYPSESEKGGGMGSHIIRHRADLIGGTLDVRRGDEGGAIISCRLPEAAAREKKERRDDGA
jgi:signal transduction histidine kinase